MARKRQHNEGTIFFDAARGNWRVQITRLDGSRASKRFRSEDEAKDWHREQILLQGRGLLSGSGDTPLAEWVLEWLDIYIRPSVRQRTFERYLSLANHLESVAHMRLRDLRPNHFQRLYSELRGRFSSETTKKIHNLLGASIKQAVANRSIHANPMDGVTPPKVVREEVETFTHEELDMLLAAAKGKAKYPVLVLAIHTGMRLGELLGLRWQDVDFNKRCIHVRQTLQHASTGIIFEPPKTKAGKRRITVPQETMDLLRQHKEKYAGISELCFPSVTGTPMQPKNFERWWAELQQSVNPLWLQLEEKRKEMKKAKIAETAPEYLAILKQQKAARLAAHKKFHAIRHTHATNLLASGEPIVDVSRRLGHSKPSTTLDVYGHSIPGNDQKLADKISKLHPISPTVRVQNGCNQTHPTEENEPQLSH